VTTVRVREVQDRDAREVAALLSELGYPTDEAAAAERLRAKHEHVLVADEGGLVVGLATLATLRTLTRARPIGRLTALVVISTHRRRGVAHRLVDATLERAEQLGCEGLELTSGLRPERQAAHAFYEALGFERTSYRYWRRIE
jgi:GNAT superfamily N-acetyltransferase